jgi:hypothetical protein
MIFLRFGACALAATLVLAGGASAAPKPDPRGPLAWMVGCWRSQDGVNTEEWSPSLGGVMFGHATTIKDGQLAYFEQTRIELRRGRAIYTASPDGQRPIDFVEAPAAHEAPLPKGAKTPPPSITFENPDHDYPQRITYRSLGNKGLAATISKLDGSQPVEYVWVVCKK